MKNNPVSAAAKASFVAHTNPDLGETYYEATHRSGLRVLVAPKEFTTFYASVGVGFGSMDQPEGEQPFPLGVAHFLEHKMFEKPGGGSFDSDFAELGADVNADTSYDRTRYYFSCTDRFDEALRLLLEMVSDLSVTAASVRRERRIITEEMHMDEDRPWDRCFDEMLSGMYEHHLIRQEICGSEASIARITPAVLHRAFDRFYVPSNMVLVVSGRVTPDEVMEIVKACFGGRGSSKKRPVSVSFGEPVDVFEKRVAVQMPVSKPLFTIGIKDDMADETPLDLLRHDLTMAVLGEMLFSHAGDFYSELFESGLVTGCSYTTSIGREFAFFALSGESGDPDHLLDVFRAYMERMHEEGLSEADFVRCRRILYADYVAGFDSTEDIAFSLCDYALDSMNLFDFLTVTSEMTFGDVTALFERVFREERYMLSVIEPSEES